MRPTSLPSLVAGALLLASQGVTADTIFYHDFNANGTLYSLDTGTGIETVVGSTGLTDSWGFDFDPAGTLYGFHRQNNSLYTIDTGNAAATLVGASGVNAVEAMAIDASGRIIVANGSGLFELSAADGSATSLGALTGATHTPDGLSFAPVDVTVSGLGTVSAGSLFSIDSGDLFVIDPATLVSTQINGNNVTNGSETLAFGPDGTLYTHDFSTQFYTFDLGTLTDTAIASTSGSIVASAVQRGAQEVPESGTLALLGLGLAALGLRRRRRG